MATITPRLDIAEGLVQRAKRAYAKRKQLPSNIDLQEVAFSETAVYAIQNYADLITQHLEAAGLTKSKHVRGRPRRIPEELWAELGDYAKDYDVKRISVLRAALRLLAASVDHEQPSTSDANLAKKRRK